jgi:hypothetical protein
MKVTLLTVFTPVMRSGLDFERWELVAGNARRTRMEAAATMTTAKDRARFLLMRTR